MANVTAGKSVRSKGILAGIRWDDVPDLFTASKADLAKRYGVSESAVGSARKFRNPANHGLTAARKPDTKVVEVPAVKPIVVHSPPSRPELEVKATSHDSAFDLIREKVKIKAQKIASPASPDAFRRAAEFVEKANQAIVTIRSLIAET